MLLHYNKGLVRQFVWRCKHLGTEVAFGELALAGDDALIKAAIKWDPNKGTRFTTYAFQRVNRSESCIFNSSLVVMHACFLFFVVAMSVF